MCEKQICRFDGKATETAIPEIDRKWLSSMMRHCLNKQRICPYRFTCQGIPWDPYVFLLKLHLVLCQEFWYQFLVIVLPVEP